MQFIAHVFSTTIFLRLKSALTDSFSFEDHFDAYSAYEYLAIQSLRRLGKSSNEYQRYNALSASVRKSLLSEKEFETAKSNAKLISAIVILNHGKRLVFPEFQ